MQIVKSEPKRKRYQKGNAPADDVIALIHLVRQNPALYNYKLQPNQRRRVDILNGWARIAEQIGSKYTVEECRRKWKNLRDTFHQYRLRKPKFNDGLSKWRYAKELDFLSNVYQPKLKSQRHQGYGTSVSNGSLLTETVTYEDCKDMDHKNISLVNDETETFILTAYEESVNDDVTSMDHVTPEDPNMAHMELEHDNDVEDVVEIVKNEHPNSLDDDGATGPEVDYEEVCLYEEAGNARNVNCGTIIGPGNSVVRSVSEDSQKYQYLDSNDFCNVSINAHGQLTTGNSVMGGQKMKGIAVMTNSGVEGVISLPISVADTNNTSTTIDVSGMQIQQQQQSVSQTTREELDLFFDFLKKKIQIFSREEITSIQVEFLNCVLRCEANKK